MPALAATVRGRGNPDCDSVMAAREEPDRFLALDDRHVPMVQGYKRLRVADRDAAEDNVGAVVLAALAALRSFRGQGTFAVRAVARPGVHDHFRADRSPCAGGRAVTVPSAARRRSSPVRLHAVVLASGLGRGGHGGECVRSRGMGQTDPVGGRGDERERQGHAAAA